MLAVVRCFQWLGVRWPGPCVAALALAVDCCADPWALWQAGFWLSFVALSVYCFYFNSGAVSETESWQNDFSHD